MTAFALCHIWRTWRWHRLRVLGRHSSCRKYVIRVIGVIDCNTSFQLELQMATGIFNAVHIRRPATLGQHSVNIIVWSQVCCDVSRIVGCAIVVFQNQLSTSCGPGHPCRADSDRSRFPSSISVAFSVPLIYANTIIRMSFQTLWHPHHRVHVAQIVTPYALDSHADTTCGLFHHRNAECKGLYCTFWYMDSG